MSRRIIASATGSDDTEGSYLAQSVVYPDCFCLKLINIGNVISLIFFSFFVYPFVCLSDFHECFLLRSYGQFVLVK